MAGLIIDTSSWVELAKPKYNDLLSELEEQIDSGYLDVIYNQIIKDEWTRNKVRIQDEIISSIRNHAKSALKISNFISKEEAEALKRIIEKYRDEEAMQVDLAKKHIDRVEKLLNNGHMVPITDVLKIAVTDRAVLKRAPFHNSKNNVADALIIFSAIDYIDKERTIQNDLIFVSANHKEFADPTDSNKIHPEIKEDSKSVHLLFTNNIGQVLKIKNEFVDDEMTIAESQFWNWVEMETEIARGK